MRVRTFLHARGRLLRLGVTGALLAVASIASLSGSALAAPTAVSPTLATAAVRSDPQVTVDRARGAADSKKWLTPAVRAEIAKEGIAAAAAGPMVAVASSGFAWCGDNVAVLWPAYDSTHDQTMTVPALIYAATPDFANAQVEIADWFFNPGRDRLHPLQLRRPRRALGGAVRLPGCVVRVVVRPGRGSVRSGRERDLHGRRRRDGGAGRPVCAGCRSERHDVAHLPSLAVRRSARAPGLGRAGRAAQEPSV